MFNSVTVSTDQPQSCKSFKQPYTAVTVSRIILGTMASVSYLFRVQIQTMIQLNPFVGIAESFIGYEGREKH